MSERAIPSYLQADPDDAGSCMVNIKAVPGAKRDEIAGLLGARLKVRVSAPPEDGKANKAICAVIADALGVRAGAVEVVRGQSNPEKTVRVTGVSAAAAAVKLG